MRSYPRSLILVTALALAFASTSPTLAKKGKGKRGPTEPGKYEDWKDEIDSLEIVAPFQRSAYNEVVVSGFDTSKTPLPEADDNSYEPAKTVLADPVTPFLEGFGPGAKKGSGGAGALVISGVVEELDPGSRAARYWGGFGAGAARAVLRIEVKDGGTGKTLLKIRQERLSGAGVAGGDYVNLMNRSLRKIGEDLALVLDAF